MVDAPLTYFVITTSNIFIIIIIITIVVFVTLVGKLWACSLQRPSVWPSDILSTCICEQAFSYRNITNLRTGFFYQTKIYK